MVEVLVAKQVALIFLFLETLNAAKPKTRQKYNESKQINTGYDESNISPQQQEVLNDAVATRAGLSCDPLHSDCPKSN